MFYTFYAEPLKLVTHLVQTNQFNELYSIYTKEAVYIFSFYILFHFVILTFNNKIVFSNFNKTKFNNFLPFLFFIICLMYGYYLDLIQD